MIKYRIEPDYKTDEIAHYAVIDDSLNSFEKASFTVFDKEKFVVAVSQNPDVLKMVFYSSPIWVEGRPGSDLPGIYELILPCTRAEARKRISLSRFKIEKFDKRLGKTGGWYDNRLSWVEAVRQAEEQIRWIDES